jgi:integrase
MASLTTEAHGGRRVQFIDMNGQRRSIRLGKIPIKQAEAVLVRVEALVSAKAAGTAPDAQTAAWVKELGDVLHERLARVGLINPRRDARLTLAQMFDRYLDSLAIKPSTERNYKAARRELERHFSGDRFLTSITVEDAQGFKRAMRDSGLAQATTAKYIKVARQLFRRAHKQKLIDESPFADISAGSQTNATRLRFISRDVIERVIAGCPDNEWRLLIALSRFGGLRCPSEHLALRWEDIDWQRGRITVNSPKTEGNENQETRIIPLFPELVPYLRQAQAEAAAGVQFVMTERYRRTDGYGRVGLNLGTQFKRIIQRTGIQPWPRVWHNLRASRQTELAERFPLHVVCSWLGNTTTVATQSYLVVREGDYETARAATNVEKAVQNPAQQAAESDRSTQNHGPDQKRQVPDLQALARSCDKMRESGMPPEGLEPSTR